MIITSSINQLPAFKISDKVNGVLKEHNRLVITAPPGAGKSTVLPLTCLDDCSGKILMLEPRRIAARQIAERMASLIDESVGETVGYRVRFESKISQNTRLEVLTEGILTRMLIADATLEGVEMVIFDEFHERNLNSDVALALVREIQEMLRPDLKIVVMSATIDAVSICKVLDAQLVECQGRMFPVERVRVSEVAGDVATTVAWSGVRAKVSGNTATTMADVETVSRNVAAIILKAHRENEGDILAFLPGQAEILRCKELLRDSLGDTNIYPLYGLLSFSDQHKAISPSRLGERKVVLATSIAETSLTIEGVRVVVDSGLCRKMVYDQRNGLSHLETVRISLDMATQRCGRAGRVAEGTCYQLWSLATEHRMAENRTPEILEADLAPMVLDILAWGTDNVMELPWLTLPPKGNVIKAMSLLKMLGAVVDKTNTEGLKLSADTSKFTLTYLGKKMSSLPCHPRISKMLLEAETSDDKALACDIASLLEERDPLANVENDTDINTRIGVLRDVRRSGNAGRWARIVQIAEQYRRMIGCKENNGTFDSYKVGKLIAMAYPERIAKAIGNWRFRLSSQPIAGNSGEAYIDSEDDLSALDWIAIATMNSANGKVFLASPLNPDDLELMPRNQVSWNSKEGRVVAQKEYRIGQLVVKTKPLNDISREDIYSVIIEASKKEGLSIFDFSDKVQMLQRRIEKVSQWHPELEIPDLQIDSVLARIDEWLPMYAGKATTSAELKKVDMQEVIWGLLSYEQQLVVDHLAPSHVQVPTGSKIRIDYRKGAEAPVLSVRLQECFGLTDTPTVNDGKQPVLMELLSPGFKPVQLTQDLRSFWQSTYFEVRKELKRRYPKHSWPENPLEAEAVRGVKRHNS